MRTTRLFGSWKGMAPDSPRDHMGKDAVWLMKDYIPDVLGAQLESRSPWTYYLNGPLVAFVSSQKWVSTLGQNHHLVGTPYNLYNADTPGSPRIVSTLQGFYYPMASLYEYVGVPRGPGNGMLFLKYTTGSSVETVLTTDNSTPPATYIEAWNSYFVLANWPGYAQRIAWLEPGFPLTGSTTPAWDSKSWWDTSNDVTGLARTRSALLVFHANGVERLRGSIPPGTNRQTDLWMEPLKGLGGCTQPHSISYWNDNVLFCDGRGAYLTDGTTITDLTAQGGISRLWRKQYATGVRVAGGIYADFWILSVTNTANGAVVATWVCNLYTRKWMQFTNVACSSFVTAVDTNEHLYGGTYDGKLIDASRMWDEADPVSANVDGNGVSVLPQLETGWFSMSDNFSRKRVKKAEIAYDLYEDSGALNVYASQRVSPSQSADWTLLRACRMRDQDGIAVDTRNLVRRKLELGYEHYGFCFKLETTGTLRNLKLYDLSVEGPIVREESYA